MTVLTLDPLRAASGIAAAGLEAQSTRLRIAAENVANARSTGNAPGADPYTRKTVQFSAELDRTLGASTVRVKSLGHDRAPFQTEYDPGNPAADASGQVKMPNVNTLLEMADMREAGRSYEANLQMIKQTRSMVAMTIDLLRS
ncbi:MAG: flagellar basal body rod protein FlgC [Rhizobiales bacterium 32-66-11]|jgi:flagellar basal-body rod protein FlgC|nr:MAG: flagellar basal body rod protein FlgC [Rhizobiales bacterium 32-66-11]